LNKLIFGALAAAASFASPAAAADLVLDSSNGFTIPVEIRRQTVNLRVDLETSGYPILNPGTAASLGFRGSLFGARAVVGPVRLSGEQNGAKFRIAGIQRSYRFAFFDRDIVEGAAGIISPHELPYDNIVFRLGAERPAEVTTALQLEFNRSGGLHYPLVLGDRRIAVEFSLIQPSSLATASSGAYLAETLGGAWTGEPRDGLVKFGVTRPLRPMRLERPLELGDFRLSTFLVRTGDHRGSYQLPTDAPQDPDEMIVTANVERQRARLYLTVGRDRLSSCSSLSYARATRILTLRCLPG
jgi:hypothetical protein